MTESIKLTQYAKGAGCGCKISPQVLHQIVASNTVNATDINLLVDNVNNDDAAVYDLGNGTALVVTADFFMPIVDDAFTFGKVAAANALSDVYAMGGKPITAIALLGWPIDKLPAELAAEVMHGAREISAQAGVVISGGHTIDSQEPFFGLSVNGIVPIENIKRNNTANKNDVLFITKPIGVGILATAQKREKLLPEHATVLIQQLTKLNSFGEVLGKEKAVTAMTDITGFGLMGHLCEMCADTDLSAQINYNQIPVLEPALIYLKQNIIPDATYRNWNAYDKLVEIDNTIDPMEAFALLPDPQTNGGLLIAVNPKEVTRIIALAENNNIQLSQIGVMKEKGEKRIYFV